MSRDALPARYAAHRRSGGRFGSGRVRIGLQPGLPETTSVGATGVVPDGESEVHDEPYLEGPRITVLHVQRQVGERGVAPGEFAGEHGLEVADVYAALTYDRADPSEMRAVGRRRAPLAAEADDAASTRRVTGCPTA